MADKLCFILFFLVVPYSSALAEEITCPPTLRIEEKVTETVPGWQAKGTIFKGNQVPKSQTNGMSIRDHMLQYIAIGDINGAGSFREDKEIIKGKIAKDTWELSDSKIRYAIICNYYTTNITLSQPVSEGTRVCESYSEVKKFMPYKFLRMTCQK